MLLISPPLFPVFPRGHAAISQDGLLDRLWHLALPAIVTTGGWSASALIRSEMLDVGADYVRTARARGLRRPDVRWHACETPIPIMTGISPTANPVDQRRQPATRFSWPGLGAGYDARPARLSGGNRAVVHLPSTPCGLRSGLSPRLNDCACVSVEISR
jgi:ABC-type dipeptide/oligopeptide/nickel transport system permease component